MAALQSYLQDADAILAEANSAPKSGIDQYLVDADAILAESQPQPEEQPDLSRAIQTVTGGEGIGGSLTRGMVRAAQAVSRPLAWMTGDTDKLNAEQQATRDAETSGTGTAIQEVTNLAAQMGLTAPLTAAIAAPLHATRLGKLAGASRSAAKAAGIGGKQLAARGAINAADNAIQMGIQSGLESGAAAIPHGALLGAAGGAVGGPITNRVGRAVAEGTVYAAGPAAAEGRAPTLEEGVYGYAFPIIQALAKVKSPSRSEMAKALGVKPQDLPPELATAEGRAQAIAEAKNITQQNEAIAQSRKSEQFETIQGNDLQPQPIAQSRENVAQQSATTPEQVAGRPTDARLSPEDVTAPDAQPVPVQQPPLSAEVSPQLPDSPPVPPPPTSIEPAPFDVPSLRTGTKGRGKGARGEFVTEHDDALEAFRTRVRSSGMRPPKNMTGEDFGKAFPLDYIKKDGAYTWDQALQEAAELGLIHPNATPDEFRALFSGKVTRRMEVDPDAATNVQRIPKQSEREITNEDMDVGDLVYRNGEWHRVIDATEDGLTLKDGEETQVGYSQTITAKGVVKPGMEEYNYAMGEYRKQEQATPSTSAEPHTRTAENPPITQTAEAPPTSKKFLDLTDEEFAQMPPDEQARVTSKFEASEQATGRMGEEPPVPLQEPVQGEPPPIPERPESTGTKNAVREEQRVARGLEPIESRPTPPNEDRISEGVRRIEENPALPDEIMARLNDEGKRAIAVGDEAVMMAESARVHKDYYDTLDQLGDPGLSKAARDIAEKRKSQIETRLDQIDQAERSAGTVWQEFGNLRQRQIREDYSLEAVLRKARAEKGGNLDPKEYETIKARVKELEDKLEAIQVQKGARPAAEIDAEIDRIIADFDVAPAESKLGSAASKGKSAVKEFTEAWSELMGGGRLGVTPQAFNEVSYAKAKPHFEKAWIDAKAAGKDLIEFMREEIAKYGRGAKPYLSRFVNENKLEMAPPETDTAIAKMKVKVKKSEPIDVKKQRAAIEDRLTARYGEGDVLDEMRPLVQRLALNFVRDGVTAREPLIDQVHGVLKRIDPRATRSQTRDLISGYGEFKPLDKEPAKKTLRELKGEMQQLGKIEDMTAKQAPKKTGVERRAPSDEERRLIKEVNDLKRKGDFATTNPDAQLKSAIDGVKTRLRNEITDLDNAIADREPLASKKNELQYDTEAKALRAKRDAKKAEYDALFPKKPLPWTEQVKRAGKVLDKQIAELDAAVKAGDVRRKKTFRLNSPELVAQRARLDALRAQRDGLRNMDRLAVEAQKERDLIRAITKAEAPAKERTKTATPDTKFQASLKKELADLRAKRKAERSDAVALNSYKTRLLNQIADIQERIAKGELEPKKRGKKVFDKDAEATRLEYEANQKKAEINDLLFEYRLKNRTREQRVWDAVQEAIGLTRAVKSSADISAIGRQGVLDVLAHPIDAVSTAKDMFRAMRSGENEFEIMRKLTDPKLNPNAADYDAVHLFISDRTNPKLATREEAYRSRFAQKVPGVAMSERGYTTFLNVMRAKRYDAMKSTLLKKGFDDIEAKKAIANYVNVATGRGGGKEFEKTSSVLSALIWSPRLVASRFQYALGQPMWKGLMGGRSNQAALNEARKIVAAEYARTALGAGVVLGVAAAAGAKIGVDPQSSDFGKIVMGKKRIDILGGLSQTMVYMARTIPALFGMDKTVTETSGKEKDVDLRTISQFWMNKSAPIVQTGIQLVTGKDVIGKKTSKTKAILTAPMPLTLEQAWDTYHEEGLTDAVIDTAISATGIGVQTY